MKHTEPYGIGSYGKPTVVSFEPHEAVLRVGKFCSMAGEVKVFLTAEHRPDWVTTYPFPVKMRKVWPEVNAVDGHPWAKGDVTIENDVWVGWGATFMSGVTVGSGAVIGAESVVTKDVPPYAIVAGNPARLVRYRFEEEERAALLEIAWWDWPAEKIRENVKSLCSADIADFIRRHR